MSVTSDFYLARADECAREAAATSLDNVRERFQRSEVAWRSMADRLTRGEALRAVNVETKAQEQTA
jgi:hypothetical protein